MTDIIKAVDDMTMTDKETRPVMGLVFRLSLNINGLRDKTTTQTDIKSGHRSPMTSSDASDDIR